MNQEPPMKDQSAKQVGRRHDAKYDDRYESLTYIINFLKLSHEVVDLLVPMNLGHSKMSQRKGCDVLCPLSLGLNTISTYHNRSAIEMSMSFGYPNIAVDFLQFIVY